MYNVSNAYLSAIEQPTAQYRLKLTIDGTQYTGDILVGGSFTIKNQCSDTDIVQIGSVYVAELKMTIYGDQIERGNWKGVEITASEGLKVGNDYEYVPLGVFYVAEANHTESGVQITAYDSMLKFDKSFNLTTTIGSPFSILKMLCQDCRVQLGMTRTQIEALPNGTLSLALYSQNDCQTYRDVLFWLAQTLGCFATIGRDGKLYLRSYKDGQGAEDADIDEAHRFEGGRFSDFVTEYSGVSYIDIDSQEYIYVKDGDDTKLTYDLGANPFMQYGTASTRKQMALNILNALKKIYYVPFQTEYLNTPAYDLGDIIVNEGGIGDGAIGCIMSYEYKYSEGYAVEGFGQNPSLATARDKVDKELAGIMSKTDKNGIQFYTFKNAEEAVIEDGERKELIYIRFSTMETKQVTFQAEILADSEATIDEVEAQIEYFLDGAVISDYKPTETWTEDGKHIINLYYMLDVEPNHLYQWQVKMTANGGTITIPQGHARGTVWGQGLVAIGAWDGFIDVEDTVTAIPLDSIYVATFTDAVSVEAQIPIAINIADQLTSITLDSIDVAQFEDYVLVNKASLYFEQMTWGDVKEYLWQEIKDGFTW